MKNPSRRHLLSASSASFFLVIAVGSSKVNKIHCGAFNTFNAAERNAPNETYLVKNDGTTVNGNKVTWQSGVILKDQIKIDDQKFKISEIRGYKDKKTYYARLGSSYIPRIIQGKLNVYMHSYTSTETSTTAGSNFTTTRSVPHCQHYVQKGEKGELKPLGNQDDIKDAVADCPAAAAMVDVSSRKIRKEIRKDRNFLNSVFELYNNNCKTPTR